MLLPLNRRDHYGPVAFTDAQWERLVEAFPNGVCDYTRPGVGQEHQTVPWMTCAGGPGTGAPLGDPPVSQPLG